MGNLLNYIDWRKDLPLNRPELFHVDLAVLARLAYMPLGGIVPAEMGENAPLPGAMEAALARPMSDGDRLLAQALRDAPCFADCRLAGYREIYAPEKEEQFAALSCLLPGGAAAAAFRGTDDTLVGWKEDFNMTFSDHIPAQRDARQYTHYLAEFTRGPIALCGHSKGGNLAMYSSVFCRRDVQDRVGLVCNYDGPGFAREIVESAAFRSVSPRMHTYLPQSSVVGMMLEHAEDFTIVESEKMGVRQHNLYRWRVENGDFVTVERRTNSSFFMDDTLKSWMASLEPEKREKTINAVYQMFTAAQGKTFRDLTDARSLMAIIRAAGNLDKEQRHALMEAGRMLRLSMKAAFPALVDRALAGLMKPDEGGEGKSPRRPE